VEGESDRRGLRAAALVSCGSCDPVRSSDMLDDVGCWDDGWVSHNAVTSAADFHNLRHGSIRTSPDSVALGTLTKLYRKVNKCKRGMRAVPLGRCNKTASAIKHKFPLYWLAKPVCHKSSDVAGWGLGWQ
jgi:hypothetical protein